MSINDFISNASKRTQKKTETTEADIENHFVKFAKKKACKALKLIFLNGRGFPDRTVLCPGGRVFFIEFKRKGKKLSATQISVKRMLQSFGFEYYVCDTKEQAEETLNYFLEFYV